MPSYSKIQDYVIEKYGFVPKTCWIADAKEKCGIPVRENATRSGARKHLCPTEKLSAIRDAFQALGML